MPRANRYFVPGHVWHVTHRCHRRAFLLRFARDRSRWMHWLYEARKRYRIRVLNYIVTCNHVHLLVEDADGRSLSRSMQLVAGRVAQGIQRKKKTPWRLLAGAFSRDRRRNGYPSATLPRIHRLEHGSSRCGLPSC